MMCTASRQHQSSRLRMRAKLRDGGPNSNLDGGLQAIGILTAEISVFCRDRLKVNR